MSFDLLRTSQAESGPAYRIGRGSADLPFRVRSCVGPAAGGGARRADGRPGTPRDPPGPATPRAPPRKPGVVECVDYGLLAFEAAASRYRLTEEELGEWRRTVEARGRAPVLWPQRPVRVAGGRMTAGGIEIDLDARWLRVGGEHVALSESEMTVLVAVAEAGGGIVSNAMLMAELYGGRDAVAGSKIVDVLVCRLRRKLGTEARRFRSVWGRGHLLVL